MDYGGFDLGSLGSNLTDTLGQAGITDPSQLANPGTGLYDVGAVPGTDLNINDILGGSQNTNVLPPGAGGGLGIDPSTIAPQPGGTGSLGGPAATTTRGSPGLFTNPDGSLNLASLLGMLAPLLAGAYTSNRTSAATSQMLNAINQSSGDIKNYLGGNAALFQPYRDVGQQGLNALAAIPQSNLSAKFQPLATAQPAGFSLGAIARRQ